MSSLIAILQAVVALLLAAQGSNVPAATQTQAIQAATNAIQIVQQTIAQPSVMASLSGTSGTSGNTVPPTAVPPPSTVPPSVTNATSTTTTSNSSVSVTPVVITSLTPASGPVGTFVTIKGTGLTASGNAVHFGIGGIPNVASPTALVTSIVFGVPSAVGPCDLNASGVVCATAVQQVTPGQYAVYVTNANGTSNSLTFTVTGVSSTP